MKNALKFYEETRLLDVDNFNFEELRLRFHELANVILNESLLYIAGNPFRITEVEFYGHSEGHQDCFTHKASEQKQFGNWYFHKIGNSYKGGNYKGLDLTLGDGVNYLGVLIRRIECCSRKISIDGPSLVVDEILRLTSSASIDVFAKNFSPESLKLVYSNNLDSREWLMSPRVGLKSSKVEDLDFLFATFRYLTTPLHSKKGKPLLYLNQYRLYGEDAAIEKTQIRSAEAEKYKNWFHSGAAKSLDEVMSNPAENVQAMCEMYGSYLAHIASNTDESDENTEVSLEGLFDMALKALNGSDWKYLNYLSNLGVESSDGEQLRIEFFKLRGISFANLEMLAEAKKDFLSALAINPNDEVVLVNFLTACFQSQDANTAAQGLELFYSQLEGSCKAMVLESVSEAIRVKDFTTDLLPAAMIEDLVQFLKTKNAS